MSDRRELPRALQPWAPYLQLMPAEQVAAIAPIVQRLDSAIGPLRVQARGGAGDPDGFDGLSRRGGYDRLLLSEWLLADEMPEEFARRAAMSEHAFLQLARQGPAGARVSRVLFDAGPNQLGAPRLAHLAALIVLARRAEASGATLVWSILQRPDAPSRSGLDASGLAFLLRARIAVEATDAHIAEWRESVGTPAAGDEFWIVGGERISRLEGVAGASLLTVIDPLEPGERALRAEIRHSERAPVTVTLELPDDPDCVRILRQPGHEIADRNTRLPALGHPPTSNLIFLPGGTKVVGRLSANQAASYPIPNSPFGGVGKARNVTARTRQPILSIGRFGRQYTVLTTTADPRRVILDHVSEKFEIRGPIELPETVPTPLVTVDTDLWPLYFLGGERWFTAIGDRLISFSREVGEPAAEHCERLAAYTQLSDGILFWLGFADGKWRLVGVNDESDEATYRTFASVKRATFCTGPNGYGQFCAVEDSSGSWRLCNLTGDGSGASDRPMEAPPDQLVIGLADVPQSPRNAPALITIAADRRSVSAHWTVARGDESPSDTATASVIDVARTESKLLFKTDSDIVQAAVCPHVQSGNWLTSVVHIEASGDLAIYSLQHNRFLARMRFDSPIEPRQLQVPLGARI